MKTETDITGKRYGRLVAIRRAENNSHGGVCWLFKCDCGKEAVLQKGQVIAGHTVSCGCKRAEGITVTRKPRKHTHEEYIAMAAERAERIRKQREGQI